MKNLTWLMFAALAACSGEQPATDTKTDTNAPGDDDDDDTAPPTDTGTETGTTIQPPAYMDPIAVGFEFDGVIRSDGTIQGYETGYGLTTPIVVLTFTDLDFFYASSTAAQTGHFCTAIAPFEYAPTAPLTTANGNPLYLSYDVALTDVGALVFVDGAGNPVDQCAGLVDPAVWGANAENLIGPFEGAHFGFGLGEMTDNLRGSIGAATLTDLGDFMLAGYIAINDAAGAFVAEDWSLELVFEWDVATGELVADADGYLVGIDVSNLPPGAFPDAYIRSFAFWYQDFVLMDFTNLTDGAP